MTDIQSDEYYYGQARKENLVDMESVQWFLAEGLCKYLTENNMTFDNHVDELLTKWIVNDANGKHMFYPVIDEWVYTLLEEWYLENISLGPIMSQDVLRQEEKEEELFHQINSEIIEKAMSIIDSHPILIAK